MNWQILETVTLFFSGDFNFNHSDFLTLIVCQLDIGICVCYLMYRACALVCRPLATAVRVS